MIARMVNFGKSVSNHLPWNLLENDFVPLFILGWKEDVYVEWTTEKKKKYQSNIVINLKKYFEKEEEEEFKEINKYFEYSCVCLAEREIQFEKSGRHTV